MNKDIKCPACQGTKIQYNYSTSTAMGWAQIYKDGELISKDPNYTVSHFTCCNPNCLHNFNVCEQYGEIIEIVDEGPTEITHIVDASNIIAESNTDNKIEDSYLYIPQNSTKVNIPYDQTQIDLEEVKKELKELRERVDKLVYLQEKMQT